MGLTTPATPGVGLTPATTSDRSPAAATPTTVPLDEMTNIMLRKRKSKYNVTFIKLLAFLTDVYNPGKGELGFWSDVLRVLTGHGLDLTLAGFVSSITTYSQKCKKSLTRNNLTPKLLEAVFGTSQISEKLTSIIQLELGSGNARSMHTAIARALNTMAPSNRVRVVPSVRDMRLATVQIRRDFIRFMKPEMTLNGFRVDLVNFVLFVLCTVYGKDSIAGVSMDVWGDCAVIGGKNVTRVGFRLVNVPGSNYASQNVNNAAHVFIFCSFVGADKRINLENNLGSSTTLGKPGFLYNQTKKLIELGAIITCSGDSPFLLRLLTSNLSDSSSSYSKMELFVADPTSDMLAKNVLDPLKVGKPKKFRVQDHPDFKTNMEAAGVVFPQTVHKVSGRRTDLSIKLIVDLHRDSLICLKNNLCILPDSLHAMCRILEHDLKMHGQFLLDGKCFRLLQRLVRNVTVRDVRNFNLVPSEGTSTISQPTITGKQARVILEPAKNLRSNGSSAYVCSIFQGVFTYDKRVPCETTIAINAAKVLTELHPSITVDNLHDFDKNGPGISRRALAELHLNSLSNIIQILRKGSMVIDIYKNWVEMYYQATLLLFGIVGLTSYKLKLDLIWRILSDPRSHIVSTRNHLCESGENSHKVSQKEYRSNTMKDGGYDDRHVSPQYSDIMNSWLRAVNDSKNPEQDDQHNQDLITWRPRTYENTVRDVQTVLADILPENHAISYLDIVQKPLRTPTLDIGKSTPGDQMRGLRFILLGVFSSLKFEWKGKIESMTQGKLSHFITEMGANSLTDYMAKSMSQSFNNLPGCYCVMYDETMLKKYENPACTEEQSEVFYQVINGHWKFIRGQYIVDCYKQGTLLNPESYIIRATDKSKYVPNAILDRTRQLERQRTRNAPGPRIVTCHAALSIHHRRENPTTLKRRRRPKNVMPRPSVTPATDDRLAWYAFLSHSSMQNKARRALLQCAPSVRVSLTVENQQASARWNAMTREQKDSFIPSRL